MPLKHIAIMMLCFAPLCVSHAQEEQAPRRLGQDILISGKAVGEGEKTRLFILSGQSNMAALKHRESFVPAIEKAFPADTLIFVKHSQSGQPIRRWYKEWQPVGDWTPRDNRSRPGNNDLYVALMKMVDEAITGKTIDTVSFVWMQGEADAKSSQSENYKESLAGLIQQIRNDTGHPNATAVVGRLSDHLKDDPHWDRVRAVQMEIGDTDPHAAWIDTDDLNGPMDGLHYSGGKNYNILGERFAEATIKLLK